MLDKQSRHSLCIAISNCLAVQEKARLEQQLADLRQQNVSLQGQLLQGNLSNDNRSHQQTIDDLQVCISIAAGVLPSLHLHTMPLHSRKRPISHQVQDTYSDVVGATL